jgi:hypothetical protein
MSAAPPPGKPVTHVHHDGYLAMFVPDSDLGGLHSFHFVVKRTYRWTHDEMMVPSPWQETLVQGDRYFDGGGPFDASLAVENELGPPKAGTDVVLEANCYAPGGEATYCRPSVTIGAETRELIVMGDRFAVLRPGHKPVFTPAAKFSVLPIRYELAYGGVDRQHSMSPLLCPTNPIGQGFLLAPIEGEAPRDRWTPLPNIENPSAMITVDSLLVAHADLQNVRAPAGFGPVPRHWEPRAGFGGMPASAKPLWTLLHGTESKVGQVFKELQPQFWSCAAPGMMFPKLEGHEKIVLRHVTRDREETSLRLPVSKPKLRAGFDDLPLQDVRLSLATVSIAVERREATLAWRGTLPSPAGLTLDKLQRVPLEVDGELVLPAPLVGTGFPLDLLKASYPGMELLDVKGLPKPGGDA